MKERETLKGDLNPVQQEALTHLYIDNREEKAALEEERMKANILANNPELYKAVFMDNQREINEDNIEWITPKDMKEAEEIIAELDRMRAMSEEYA